MAQIRHGMGHAFIVGSGIAALSIGEILSRNGWRITLFESTNELGGDASRRTQNWFHTGWLYAGLPQKSAMRGCFRAVRLLRKIYGPVLPPEVVNIDETGPGLAFPPSASGWFSAERVHYIYAIRSRELSFWQRVTWRHYLDWVVLGRLRELGYPTESPFYQDPSLTALLQHWEHDSRGHERYRVIPSTDARIHTGRVLTSLLQLLGSGAEAVRNARYRLASNGERTTMHFAGEAHTPDLLVLASGKSIPRLLESLGYSETARRFRSICSPIVVLKRLIELPSFIRFTPQLYATVNHIRYSIPGAEVSTVGSYDSYPVDQAPDISPFVERVCGQLGITPQDVAGTYYGTKTELVDSLSRRYNHAVDSVNANTFFAIAGKFSQFPLLASDFAEKLGLSVDIENARRGKSKLAVAPSVPEQLFRSYEASQMRWTAQG